VPNGPPPGPRLLLSAGTLPHASFRDRVEAARQAGFDAISLFPQQYLRALGKEKLRAEDMCDILATNNISLDEVDPLLDWFGSGPAPGEDLVFEIATVLGARSINAPAAFAPDIELSQLTAALKKLGQRCARERLRLDLEFLPWCLVPNLSTALQVVADTGESNIGVMLDFWHFFRSGDELATVHNLSIEQARRITSIQVCDLPAHTRTPGWRNRLGMASAMFQELSNGIRISGYRRFFSVVGTAKTHVPGASILMKEAMSARLLPGTGDFPVAELLATLRNAGCQPTIGIEVFSLDLARQSPLSIAQQAMLAYRGLAPAD
jgi:sugar phosphate isomerase/epimerase